MWSLRITPEGSDVGTEVGGFVGIGVGTCTTTRNRQGTQFIAFTIW